MPSQRDQFQLMVLPHLEAAYNLARWLTRNDQDAQDVVQDAYLRAWRSFSGFRGESARAWLLTIVRNASLTHLSRGRQMMPLDEQIAQPVSDAPGPDAEFIRAVDAAELREAIDSLPVEFREVIVLRELESLSYKEVAKVAGIPIGTVMSRLSRARHLLEQLLVEKSTSGGLT